MSIGNPLQAVKDALNRQLYGMTVTEAQTKGICIRCKLPAADRCKSKISQDEYKISALCDRCFTQITKQKVRGESES